MSESLKTKAYKERRQERISLNEYRKATETQEMQQAISESIELQNSQRISDDWQNWRLEVLYGYRYARFIRSFNSTTKAKMMAHIKERKDRCAPGPSEAEASFRLLIELMEARKAFSYECESGIGRYISRLLHAYNYHLLKSYIKTVDMELLGVIPFRFQSY